jgi:hypothetical protein
MTKYTYNAASLERLLGTLECRYGMASDELYNAHLAGDPLEDIPRFHRQVWLSFYREALQMRGEDFFENAERALALA